MKFTFRGDPLQKGFWGTLVLKVNFTARGTPCQKYLRSLSGNPVKFTFRADPRQKAFWGRLPSEVERLCVHLGALPPLQCLQRHIALRGEFHRSGNPCLKCPRGRLGVLVKFTFRADPRQKAFWGTLVSEVNFTG